MYSILIDRNYFITKQSFRYNNSFPSIQFLIFIEPNCRSVSAASQTAYSSYHIALLMSTVFLDFLKLFKSFYLPFQPTADTRKPLHL